MLELSNIEIRLQGKPLFPVIDLVIKAGEVVTIMGSSGCGKSTLLSAIVGDLAPEFEVTGEVSLAGRILNNVPMEQRKIGLLYQDDLLFPHLDVSGNLAFALPRGLTRGERDERINQALGDAGLSGYGTRDVATLSGGERSRVSLLRTLLSEPGAVLLDEPFGRLDVSLRTRLRDWVFDELERRSIPALLVTHDRSDTRAAQAYQLVTGQFVRL